jgi:hypothetical protein
MHQLGQGRIHLSVEENAEEVIKKETKKEKKKKFDSNLFRPLSSLK